MKGKSEGSGEEEKIEEKMEGKKRRGVEKG